MDSGKLRLTITDLHPWLRCLAFSPDGQILATGGGGPVRKDRALTWVSSEVRLWDVRTGQEDTPPHEPIHLGGSNPAEQRKPWDRPRPLVPRIAFSADGRRLASINGPQPVQLWDVGTRLPALTLPVQSSFQCLAFSRDGRWLVAGAGAWLLVWDAGVSRQSDKVTR